MFWKKFHIAVQAGLRGRVVLPINLYIHITLLLCTRNNNAKLYLVMLKIPVSSCTFKWTALIDQDH